MEDGVVDDPNDPNYISDKVIISLGSDCCNVGVALVLM